MEATLSLTYAIHRCSTVWRKRTTGTVSIERTSGEGNEAAERSETIETSSTHLITHSLPPHPFTHDFIVLIVSA